MKILQLICLLTLSLNAISQTTINGFVSERDGTPIIGANIFIEGSYDGAITEVDGTFSFETFLTGEHKLQISYLGYERKTIKGDIASLVNLTIKLRASAQSLDAVEITASTFKAGDNSKVAVLNPLDVVTTAGSMGDVMAAMQNLPGTQANPEDGRLFIRGGDARETKIFIDGMRVFSPFTRTVAGTPSRGRYSPFLFKGISFSTGGYGVEFGQALSGVLDMNTIDEAKQNETNLSLMTVGLGIGHTQKGEKQSISFSGSYIDLTPYYKIAKTQLNLKTPFRGVSGESVYRYNTEKGLLKFYLAGDYQNVAISRFNLDTNGNQDIVINNYNYYANGTYKHIIDDKSSYRIGVSGGINKDRFEVDNDLVRESLSGVHAKFQFKSLINDHFIVSYGLENIYQEDGLTVEDGFDFDNTLDRHISAGFFESDYFFSQKLAIKFGGRVAHNSLFKEWIFNPRVTAAQKLGDNSQLSLSYGQFSQEIDTRYIHYNLTDIISESSEHFLINFNKKTKKDILRLEAFYKTYDGLLKYDIDQNNFFQLNNNGNGFAYGFETFYRANRLIKNTDFWVSYSFLKNERNYLDYPTRATPAHSTTHNLSVVSKIWFEKLQSQLSLTYQFASGRPYENPNTEGFLNERAKPFHNFSFSWAYLISQQKILFISASNLPGIKNEFGYRYASNPDSFGQYPSEVIRPNDDRFFFMGFFVTISADKTKNQLDNL